MYKLIIRRLLMLVLRVFILSFVVFYFLVPWLSLDEVFYWYWTWMRGAVTGNFDWSWQFNMSVLDVIRLRLPNTIRLIVVTLIMIYGIGIPLGIISGRNPNSWKDRITLMTTQIGASFPPFTLALVLIITFALGLRWFPHRGSISVLMVHETRFFHYQLARLHHVILPALSLAVAQFIIPMKYLRGGIIETTKQAFITTAWAKGVTEKDVFKKHVFKNALPPLIAVFPVQLATVISGAIIIEGIFVFPGLGDLIFTAFRVGDVWVVLTLTLMLGITTMLLTIIADILVIKLDPRVEFEKN